MSAGIILDRLEGVRQTAPGRWLARCPAHADRSPSLSIRELDDGRVLIHDFAGCEVHEILAHVGLNFADLFEKPLGQQFAPTKSRTSAAEVLGTLDHETHVVAIIGADMLENRAIDEPTWKRLAAAVERIGTARARSAPARVPK
jgi:hypothetical protein